MDHVPNLPNRDPDVASKPGGLQRRRVRPNWRGPAQPARDQPPGSSGPHWAPLASRKDGHARLLWFVLFYVASLNNFVTLSIR